MSNSTGGSAERRALEILRALILTPSAPHDDKKPIIEKAIGPLEGSGFECEIVGEDRSPALIAHRGEGGILLSGHLDTVPLGDGWKTEQGELRGPSLYGRGAADMKGGCAAMLMAAERSAEADVPISIAFTTDEETGMRGAEHLAKHRAVKGAAAIVVCEPTSMKVGVREKGLLQIRITATGRSAHAAMPREGENAVHKMLSALEKIRPMTGLPDDPMADMTMSVSVMRGGEKVNVIPDSCVAEIDIRTPPDVQPDAALATVRGRLAGTDLDLQVINQLSPIVLPEDSPLMRKVSALQPGIGRMDIAYATELVKFSALKVDMLAIGPGDPKCAHRTDERIEVREVAEAADLYSRLCAAP